MFLRQCVGQAPRLMLEDCHRASQRVCDTHMHWDGGDWNTWYRMVLSVQKARRWSAGTVLHFLTTQFYWLFFLPRKDWHKNAPKLIPEEDMFTYKYA